MHNIANRNTYIHALDQIFFKVTTKYGQRTLFTPFLITAFVYEVMIWLHIIWTCGTCSTVITVTPSWAEQSTILNKSDSKHHYNVITQDSTNSYSFFLKTEWQNPGALHNANHLLQVMAKQFPDNIYHKGVKCHEPHRLQFSFKEF